MDSDYARISEGNLVRLIHDGVEYERSLLGILQSARQSIHLQVYILKIDSFGELVYRSLIEARQRGVAVFLMVDSVGSSELEDEYVDRLHSSGVQFCRFNRIAASNLFQWGRRLHHKITLVDQQRAIVGGINISSAYEESLIESPRLDYAVYLEGPITTDLATYCWHVFTRAHGDLLEPPPLRPPLLHEGGVSARVSVNDWAYRRWHIARDYSQVVKNAKRSITVINSYFFPRKRFMRRLVRAVRRGVRVRLILPKISDWPSLILASQYLYSYFLKHGVEIYQWKRSILHGKLATVDGTWSTIGSFNLNYTSYQGNLEMNIDVYSSAFAQRLEREIDELIRTGCERIDPEEFSQKSSLLIRCKRAFYYLLVSLVANFSLAFIFQEEAQAYNVIGLKSFLNLLGVSVLFMLGIIGILLPILPGVPFLILGFILFARQILLSRRGELSD